ncbi:hypothetical protein DID73_00470 [Candidatus Marinamargulisbacteria bacterium SCGC AG-343-K17]|nr:hypothetical protein DID73_00470 [Candidatus Marinamargulisbacteria bacterium SCGC AG-343-K17]
MDRISKESVQPTSVQSAQQSGSTIEVTDPQGKRRTFKKVSIMSRIKALALSLIPRWLRGGKPQNVRVAPDPSSVPVSSEPRVTTSPIKEMATPSVSKSKVEAFSGFPNDFKAVVAQKKLLSEVSSDDLKSIGQHMNDYFESQGLSDLRQSIHLSDANLASAWMMKLSFNRKLTDQQFLTYMKRGESIFTSDTVPDLNFTSKDANDLPAMAWYLKGVSGQQLFEKGATRVHLTNDKTWDLFQKMQGQMKERISTHFSGTKLTDKGYGKDIPSESLRDDMPFQFGALLMYPTSQNANEDLFALRLSEMNDKEITEDSVTALYDHAFDEQISAPMLQAILQNKAGLTAKLDVFKLAHQVSPERFNIDLGVKLEDFGHGDRSYHTAVHSKYGKPLAFLKKKIWNIGSKKTNVKSAMAKSIKGGKVKMAARKEHMSTIPKPAQELALRMADLMPDFQRGTKTRIDFSFKSLKRGMQEDTIQLKTSTSSSKGKTTSISYLMERAAFSSDPQVQTLLRQLEAIMAPLQASNRIGVEGSEERLIIGEFFDQYSQDFDPTNAKGAQQHHKTNVSDAKRLADLLTVSNSQGAVHLFDTTQHARSSEGYFLDCYKTLMAACEPHDSQGSARLAPMLNASQNVQDFFRDVSPNDTSLFVQVMKAFNQRSTGFPVERVTSQYAQAGYTITDKNDQNKSIKDYSVSFDNGQAKVTQKIQYFIRSFDDPAQTKGSFEMTFTTAIDIATKKVAAISTDIVSTSQDVPLESTFGRLMTELSFNR